MRVHIDVVAGGQGGPRQSREGDVAAEAAAAARQVRRDTLPFTCLVLRTEYSVPSTEYVTTQPF